MTLSDLHESYNEAYRTAQLEAWCSRYVPKMFDVLRQIDSGAIESPLEQRLQFLAQQCYPPPSPPEPVGDKIRYDGKTR